MGIQIQFSVDYPNEYVISVGGSYDHVDDYFKTVLIKSLIFKTNKGRTSPVFGGITESGQPAATEFTLEGKYGEKLIGFFGRSGQALDAIGAYFSPTPMLRGKWIQVEQQGKGPGPRCSHAIAMVGQKMYSFGGELTPNFHIDQHLYVFDFNTRTWSLAPPNGEVPELACLGVGMVAIGTTLYVFGGRDGNRYYNDTTCRDY
uniref:Jacalin-type lectin domain-containing protein n=1 Tax=Brassica campestris TaxID=3711 RepID=M4DR00_BRACM